MELADRRTDNLKMMRAFVPPRAAMALALSVMTGACASTGAVPRPFPTPGSSRSEPLGETAGAPAAVAGDPADAVDDYALVGTALSLRGTPYRNGGSDTKGFDCSGFTQYVYAQYGVPLPRAVHDQFDAGKSVKSDEVEPGDLLFFTTVGPGPTHVAIAIGGDQFVHAPSSTGVVRVERLSTSYWSTRYLGARRITPL
jgi:cell wall-associated NlpC family hydrolase